MRTNIVIDDDLINEAISLTGIRTKRELVNLALQELVAKRKKKDLFKLAGQIEFSEDFDHKKARVLRHDFDWYLGLDSSFKDKQGTEAQRIQTWLDEREVVLTRFNLEKSVRSFTGWSWWQRMVITQ